MCVCACLTQRERKVVLVHFRPLYSEDDRKMIKLVLAIALCLGAAQAIRVGKKDGFFVVSTLAIDMHQ